MDSTEPNEEALSDQEFVEEELQPTDIPEITKQKVLKPLLAKEYDFKEYSETQYMFECRQKIYARLKTLRLEDGVLTTPEIEVISRMINNKIWYNVSYDKDSESFIAYILSLI
jgi:hypothetical protein